MKVWKIFSECAHTFRTFFHLALTSLCGLCICTVENKKQELDGTASMDVVMCIVWIVCDLCENGGISLLEK